MIPCAGFLAAVLFVFLSLKETAALKNVKLKIEPPTVRLYQDSLLYCTYDLEGELLYSVKWYRGKREFYRYTPTETTKTKVFKIEGFIVQEDLSNSTQVYLRNISDFKLSGNFSCEVTTEGKTISERKDEQTMLVVQLPEHAPKISVGREPLDYGDTLRANCSSPPSKPRAELRMSLNNLVIGSSDMTEWKNTPQPTWSDLSVELILTEFHFRDGVLKLECVAQVAEIYSENAVLHLESARHPVPERVSYGSGDAAPNCNTVVSLIVLISLLLIS